ncbi:extracellular solute-binding protein [Neobacillus notoginsengisoli]|uniref:Extracellular solute-binding protein n=1 Tax=Neobacillus notoginsengisoli TaxID=1578198 RepID=A0A417YPK3_9BACI|nr:extracellular solute-binding protein [Neobacillus notoginsengisoli]RHW35771.1 extracellular solute-binding protein [Neobacillus notoginsengisoli]
MRKMMLIIGLVLTLILSACSNSSSSKTKDGDGKENITLSMWVFGSPGYDKFLDAYKKVKPNVTIKIQSADYADHHDNLFTAISAGSGAPDIAMIENGYIQQYLDAQDKFNNLADFGANDIKGDYLDWKWKVGTSKDGKFVLGIPTDIGPTVMYYRTDLFEKAGLPTKPDEVKGLIKTWDDFREAALKIKEKTGVPMTDNADFVFSSIRDQAPESYFNTKDELIIESSPYVKEAYDYTVKLIKDGVVGKVEMWSPEWGTGMNEGSFATLLAPAWLQNVITGNAPDASGKWAITQLPEGAANDGGSYLGIPSQSKHAKEAYEFIAWLLSPENQLESFKAEGLFPSTPSIYKDPAFTEFTHEYFSNTKTAQAYAEAAEQVDYVYTGKYYSIADTEIETALTNVAVDGRDPEKEWKEAVKRIKRQIERQ